MGQAVREFADFLQQNYSGSSEIDAVSEVRLIMLHILGISIEEYFAKPDILLQPQELKQVQNLVKKRADAMPLAKIFGEKEFFSLKFFTNRNTLDPRPETEHLVEQVLSIIGQIRRKYNKEKKARDIFYNNNIAKNKIGGEGASFNIIDAGTGTACVITSIAYSILSKSMNTKPSCNIRQAGNMGDVSSAVSVVGMGDIDDVDGVGGVGSVGNMASDMNFIAFDASIKALEIAQKNLNRYNLQTEVKLLQANWLADNFIDKIKQNFWQNAYNIFIANPPYVDEELQQKDDANLRSINVAPLARETLFDPKEALFAEDAGLFHYPILTEKFLEISQMVTSKQSFFLYEIGQEQAKQVKEILMKHGLKNIKILQDLAGKDRIATATT